MVAAGITIIPSQVMGKRFGYVAPSDKLNIAGIGVGGMGRNNLREMAGEISWRSAVWTGIMRPELSRIIPTQKDTLIGGSCSMKWENRSMLS